jgi:hypothetical protein
MDIAKRDLNECRQRMMLAVHAGTWTQLADFARAMGCRRSIGTGSSAVRFPGREWSNPRPYVVQTARVSDSQGSRVVLTLNVSLVRRRHQLVLKQKGPFPDEHGQGQ